jgi:hypothetical protein
MNWTTDKPTKPGWYWYRTSEEDKTLYMVNVRELGGHINAIWSDGRSERVIDMPGEWQGPLEPRRDR